MVRGPTRPLKIIATLLTCLAYHIFKYNALSRMIFRAADLNIFLKMSPNSGITRGGALDTDVAQRMQEKLSIMFDKPGQLTFNLVGQESS